MSQYGSPPDQPDPDQPPQNQPPQGPNPYGAPPPPQDPYGAQQQDPYGSAPPPPQDPYGAPPAATPYGGQQPNPYGGSPNPYGGAPNSYGNGGGAPSDYAGWVSRVGASLLDALLSAVAGLPLWIGYGILIGSASTTTDANGVTTTNMNGGAGSAILILVGALTYLAFWIWNVCIRQGRTGQTIGKGVLAIRLVGRDGQPIGGGLSFVRQLAHFLDGICYVGYLWPLWDSKRQTFADKIMGTVVVNVSSTRQV